MPAPMTAADLFVLTADDRVLAVAPAANLETLQARAKATPGARLRRAGRPASRLLAEQYRTLDDITSGFDAAGRRAARTRTANLLIAALDAPARA